MRRGFHPALVLFRAPYRNDHDLDRRGSGAREVFVTPCVITPPIMRVDTPQSCSSVFDFARLALELEDRMPWRSSSESAMCAGLSALLSCIYPRTSVSVPGDLSASVFTPVTTGIAM